MGPERHLDLLPQDALAPGATCLVWPVPFADGLAQLEGLRGRATVVLASGDPFHFGAGSVIARMLEPVEWRALPSLSVFSLIAARLGWPLERTLCRGLHAAPLSRLRADLAPGRRLIVTLRDGAAVSELALYLSGCGFGDSQLWVFEALGGPREQVIEARADAMTGEFGHPVSVAIEVAGSGEVLPVVSGRPDETFAHDGQISKRPIRALALSALAPRPGERLWDIGSGSGSIALEWLLSDPACEAISLERDPVRAGRISENAEALGVQRLEVQNVSAPDGLDGLAAPDAVFIGGGLSEALLENLAERLSPGTRLVAHAVTLSSEALLSQWQAKLGGALSRIEISEAAPLAAGASARLAWQAAYPIVQWRVVL